MFNDRKYRPSLDTWEKELLSAAREAGLASGGPIPANLIEMLMLLDACIADFSDLGPEIPETRYEILELMRLKARRQEMLKLPIPVRLLRLVHDEGPMSIDEAVERCASGDYGKISKKVARSTLDGLLTLGLMEGAPHPDRQRGTVH